MKKSDFKPLVIFVFALSIFAMAYLNSGNSLTQETLTVLDPIEVLDTEPEIILPDVSVVKTVLLKIVEAL